MLSDIPQNIKEELDRSYSHYKMERPEGYYGYLSEEVADLLKEQQSDAQTESYEQTMWGVQMEYVNLKELMNDTSMSPQKMKWSEQQWKSHL